MSVAIVLAAGPAFGGEMTRPYRHVILKWPSGEFSVHTEYLTPEGPAQEFADGHYFGFNYVGAIRRFTERVNTEVGRRPECLIPGFFVEVP